jgi:hypothetical protein
MKFEREFLKLAATVLSCHLVILGGRINGSKAHRWQLWFHCLGVADYCNEMRLLCAEVLNP